MFVSNLAPDVTRKKLLKLFKDPGHPVESVRIRGAPSVSEEGVKLPENQKGNSSMERRVLSNLGSTEGKGEEQTRFDLVRRN